MASDYRKYMEFENYEGEIKDDEYHFPVLYKTDSFGEVRIWKIYVRLVLPHKNVGSEDYEWNVLDYNRTPVKAEYLEVGYKLPNNYLCQYWVETGRSDGKIVRSPPVYPTKKNIGRSNERNVLQQGILEARNEYLKKVNKGYQLTEKLAVEIQTAVKQHAKYYPMLAKKFKEQYKKIKYPAYIQPKLNGIRAVVYLQKEPKIATVNDVIIYTRELKEAPGWTKMKIQLFDLLKFMWDETSVYLDGEFYRHNIPLNVLSGEYRNDKKNSGELTDVHSRFMIFDLFYPNHPKMVFSERSKIINEIIGTYLDGFNKTVDIVSFDKKKSEELAYNIYEREYNKCQEIEADENKFLKNDYPYDNFSEWEDIVNKPELEEKNIEFIIYDWIGIVPTKLLKNKIEVIKYYYLLLSGKFEGAMIRNKESIYGFNLSGKESERRTIDLQKLKPAYESEYKVINFTEGKGTNKGAIIWVCTTGQRNFNVTPKNTTLLDRKNLFIEVSNNSDLFIGRMLTVQYEECSEYGVPLRGKSLGFRDFM
jgi:hypothetical protein